MKKLFLIILLGGFFLPLTILAGSYSVEDYNCPPGTPHTYTVTYEGLVPCGRCFDINPGAPATYENECGTMVPECVNTPVKFMRCTVCHFFVMIDGIIDFILLRVIPPIGTIILIFAGVSLYAAGASPERLSKAKKLLLSAIIGLVIVYTSWIVVNTALKAIGATSWVGFGEGWFQINCAIEFRENQL